MKKPSLRIDGTMKHHVTLYLMHRAARSTVRFLPWLWSVGSASVAPTPQTSTAPQAKVPRIVIVKPDIHLEPITIQSSIDNPFRLYRSGPVADIRSSNRILWQMVQQSPLAGRAVRVQMPGISFREGDHVADRVGEWAARLAREPLGLIPITVKRDENVQILDADAWLKAKVLQTTADGRFCDLLPLDEKTKLFLFIHDFSTMTDKDVMALDDWCRAQNDRVSIFILSGKFGHIAYWDDE
jgi:hypothetical protein